MVNQADPIADLNAVGSYPVDAVMQSQTKCMQSNVTQFVSRCANPTHPAILLCIYSCAYTLVQTLMPTTLHARMSYPPAAAVLTVC
jgi:hypothetical protein